MARKAPIALATCQDLPRSCPDDAPLLEALAKAGWDARTVPWDDASTDWTRFGAVVVRATWDYFLRPEAFLAWVGRLEAARVPLWNQPAVLRWNSDKRYLLELEARGVPVVPTWLAERGEALDLAALQKEAGWEDLVVKPAVSGGAHRTVRVPAGKAAAAQAEVDALLRERAVLAQPFVPEVAEGEWSFVFLGGRYSHAVLKRPRAGDFRVQEKHGGTAEAAKASPSQVAQAQAVLDAVPWRMLYARVDMVKQRGAMVLMELEVLEPELFFRTAPGSAERFVAALAEHVRP